MAMHFVLGNEFLLQKIGEICVPPYVDGDKLCRKTGWQHCVECPQHIIRLEAPLSVHKLFILPAFDMS